MSSVNLEGVKIGEHLAVKVYNRVDYVHKVSRIIYRVTKITPTQVVAEDTHRHSREIRVRIKDGHIFGGGSFSYVEIATPEIIKQHNAEVAIVERYRAAVSVVDDLINQPLHRLKLTTEQLEALAKAWQEVKAMAPKPADGEPQ